METIYLFNKKTIILIATFFCFFTALNAQDKPNNFWDNVRFGGGIGLSITDGFFSGTLAPSAIYDFNNDFSLGLGLNATYNKRKNFYKSTILGGSLIGLYNPTNAIQISAEYEQLNVNRRFDASTNIKNDNYWSPALFVGAGFRNRNVTFGIKYDLLYKENTSIYANAWTPFVRVYF